MCENNPSKHFQEIFFRRSVPSDWSTVSCDIADRDKAFGLLDIIKLESPDVRRPPRNLWKFGIFDPNKFQREIFRGQEQQLECSDPRIHNL